MSDGTTAPEPGDTTHEPSATPAPEPEVRPEEFTAGITSSAEDAWNADVVRELEKPLDPNRIRRKDGRGSGKLEYLAGHDVKRRATEIFGFGNWGHRVVEMREIGATEVTKDGRDGWHIGYMGHVRIWINSEGGLYESDGIGYGDGVEYTPAAFVASRELAMKEAETDALKRAFTNLGDQFGLVLYAKADEKRRGKRDENAEGAQSRQRGNARHAARRTVPVTWPEIDEWAAPYGPDLGWKEWVKQASFLLYDTEDARALTPAQKRVLGQKASGAIVKLRETVDPSRMPPVDRGEIQAAWAHVLDGQILPGPPWRLDPSEAYETREALLEAEAVVDEQTDLLAAPAADAYQGDALTGPPDQGGSEDDVEWLDAAPSDPPPGAYSDDP